MWTYDCTSDRIVNLSKMESIDIMLKPASEKYIVRAFPAYESETWYQIGELDTLRAARNYLEDLRCMLNNTEG